MVCLGDICTKASSSIRQSDLEDRNGIYPVYGASGFIKNVDFYEQNKPYVAVVKDGAGVGRVMYLPAFSSVIGTMQYIIPNAGTNACYLSYAMSFMNLSRYYTGATIPHIYFKDYCSEQLPSHTQEEQNYIASVLEKTERIITCHQSQYAKLDELVKSQFVEMFGDPFLNPKGLKITTIGDVCDFYGGSQPPRSEFIFEPKDGYIRLIQIRDYKTNEYITYVPKDKCRRFCDADDIMIGRYGPPIFQVLQGIGGAYNVALMKAVPHGINKEFMRAYLKRDELLRHLEKFQQRTAGQAGIDMMELRSYPCPLPSEKEQFKFVKIIQQSEKLKIEILRSVDKLKTLKAALMQDFFA